MLQQTRIGQREQHISRWKTVFAHFTKQGLPSEALSYFCIKKTEAEQIGRIIEKVCPQTILEVGTFVGVSTGLIALSRVPGSTLVCIDPNLPVENFINAYMPQANFTDNRGSFDYVRGMLAHFGQEQHTIVLEYFSPISKWRQEKIIASGGDPEQAPIIGEKVGMYAPFDLAFVDGDHHTDAVYRDLCLLEPYMAQDGIIILHDVSGNWGEQVCTGIAQFMENHADFSLKTDNNLGFLFQGC